MPQYKDALINLFTMTSEMIELLPHHGYTIDAITWKLDARRREEMQYLARRKLITLQQEGEKIEFRFNKKGRILALRELVIREEKQLPDGEALLFIFDIPEPMRKVRSMLRRLLKEAGFTLLQRSVWHGKSDVLNNFRSLIKDLGVEKYVYIYRILDEYR